MINTNIDLFNYPKLRKVFQIVAMLLDDPNKEVTRIDFKLNEPYGFQTEVELYHNLGLIVKYSPDSSAYFKDKNSHGFSPTSYGWSSCFLKDLRDDAAVRIEYLLEKEAMYPFRFEAWWGTYPDRHHKNYEVSVW